MTTIWYYWSVLLLLFLFPTTTQIDLSSTTEQKTAIQNEVDLTQILTKEQTQELKEGVAFLKEVMPRLEMADKAVLVADEGELSIPKGKFISTALAQLKLLSGAIDTITHNMGKYSLRKDVLASELNALNFKTPFAKELREKIIANSDNSVTGFITATNRVIGEYENKNGALLKEHYSINETEKPYKEYYKKKEVLVSDLENDIKLLTGLLDDCVSEAIDDPKFLPNIEDAKEQKNEAKEREKEIAEKQKETAAKISDFKKVYENWIVEQEKICSEIASSYAKTDSVFKIPKSAFLAMLAIKSDDWFKSQPELTKNIRLSISTKLASLDSVTIIDCACAMSLALSWIKTPMETICLHWFHSPKLPSYSGLKTAIIGATAGTSNYGLIGAYMDWAASIAGAADSLKLSSNQQFVKSKLLSAFATLMKQKEISFFYPTFEQNLNALGREFPSLKDVSAVWHSTLYDVIVNSPAVSDYYDLLMKENNANLPIIVGKMTATLNGIADVDTIQRLLDSCKRPPAKKQELAKGEPLELVLYFKDGTILTNSITTSIVNVDGKACAIPNAISLAVSNGNLGYDFELKDYFDQSPVQNGEEGVTTYFQFKLAFSKNKGSSTHGSSKSNEYSGESGWEQSVNNVEMTNFQASSTTGGTVKSGLLTKIVVDGEITQELTLAKGSESGTETTKGTFGSLGYAHGTSSSDETTTEKGTNSGYFLVKGYLYSYEHSAGGTLVVDVVLDSVTTPNSKGLTRKGETMTKKKTLRWAK